MLAGKLRWFVVLALVFTLCGMIAGPILTQEPTKSSPPLFSDAAAPPDENKQITKYVLGIKPLVLGVVRRIMNDNREKKPLERRADAEVVVTQVLHGPSKLLGQKFVTWSAGEVMAGANIITGAHYPLLEIGDFVLLSFESDDPDIDSGYLQARTLHLPVKLDEATVFSAFGIEDQLRRANYAAALRKIPEAEFEAAFYQGLRSPEEWVVDFTISYILHWERTRRGVETNDKAAILARLTPLFKNLPPLGVYTLDKALLQNFHAQWSKDPARYALNEKILDSAYAWDERQLVDIYRNLFSFANAFDAAAFKKTRERFQAALIGAEDSEFKKLALLKAGCEFITNRDHSNERRTMIVDNLIGVLETSSDPEDFKEVLDSLAYQYDLPLSTSQITLLRDLKIKPEVLASARVRAADQIKFLLSQQK